MAKFEYSRWRHGGWYVHNVRYPSGACGCVSNNYDDKKWRIACDERPFDQQPTFSSRDDAAGAEMSLVYGMKNPRHVADAAPDMLAALLALLPEIDSEIEQRQHGGNDEDWASLQKLSDAGHAAVRKARGE